MVFVARRQEILRSFPEAILGRHGYTASARVSSSGRGHHGLEINQMKCHDITIRINEYGIHVCDAATVRHDFGSGIYYNEPFESVQVELTGEEQKLVYKFRSKYPAESNSSAIFER